MGEGGRFLRTLKRFAKSAEISSSQIESLPSKRFLMVALLEVTGSIGVLNIVKSIREKVLWISPPLPFGRIWLADLDHP